MPNPLLAILGSAALSAVGSIVGAGKAAKGQKAARDESARQYDQDREDLAPWREAGVQALAFIKAGLAGGLNAMENFGNIAATS